MTRDDEKEIEQVARMDWDDFAGRLETTATRAPGAVGAAGTAADEEPLRKYFGDEEFEELKRLATRSRALRQRGTLLGNVVLLPGIMGSNLVTTAGTEAGGEPDLVWINLLGIAKGRLARLKLTADGSKEDDPAYRAGASVVDKRTYARALLRLGARWNVQPFPFDWRKHLDAASDALAKLIEARFPGEPVHLVAHSMGGLVARNFIRRHKALWAAMRGDRGDRGDGSGPRGGLLVMLGTPNYGSFAIPQALTGVEKMVHWLERIDFQHDLKEVLAILNSFVGSYLMLPAPGKIPAETREIYRRETWGAWPVSAEHLETAREFHRLLEEEATADPERMVYIAGCNQETLLGLRVHAPGDFRYVTTHEGDGRVPFTLGLLKDVPTYYVEESHGSLPKNQGVLDAVDQILERGTTEVLSRRPLRSRATVVEQAPWHRPMGEHLVESKLERIARRAEAGEADADELRFAEEMLTRAVNGEARPARPAGRRVARGGARRPFTVEVVLGDVTRLAAPVVVVGSYKGVLPINAIGAIDKALDFWISEAIQRSMLGADLGQVFFVPVQHGQIAADAVLVAGMGEEGKFGRYDLRYLLLNVTFAIAALGVDSFASVLIGAGKGSLSIESAVQGMLFGVCDALGRLPKDHRIERLILVEINPDRHRQIVDALEAIKEQDSAGALEVRIATRKLKQTARRTTPPRPQDLPQERFGPRITVERDGDVFRFSALTREAVVSMREAEIQSFFSEGIAERLMKAGTREEQEVYGRLLNTGLVPSELQEHYQEPLTLILDRTTAAFPWEMACFERPEGLAFFGTHLALTRQFRTLLSSTPGSAPPLNEKLRVLVVADPAPEPELQLPGARAEGREVVRLLERIKQATGLDIEVVARIGLGECDPIEILGLLLNEVFDVVHFAGHGIFDAKRPNRSGWVFGADREKPGEFRTLSAREVFRARRVPRLVFSNACFSAVVTEGKAGAAEMNQRLAGLAEAFFERGVPNYIGAGWPVQDDLALRFAGEFYAQALAGLPASAFAEGAEDAAPSSSGVPQTLSQALAAARRAIAHEGPTWGAYQHYGQADARLVTTRPAAKASAPPGGGSSKAKKAPAAARNTKKQPAKKKAPAKPTPARAR